MSVISLQIDDQWVAVPAGTTLLAACAMVGVRLPQLCHHEQLTPVAACRLCLVEVQGSERPLPACHTAAAGAMVVRTTTDALVQQRRQLIVPWIQTASLLGIARNTVKVGFPTSESFARDSLMRPAQVSFLESLAKELTGQAMKFEFVLDPSLKAPEFSEMGLGLLDEPAPAPKPKAEPKPVAKEEAPKAAAAATSAEVPPPPQVDDSFYNDPLIQSAMVRFKAKLAPVG